MAAQTEWTVRAAALRKQLFKFGKDPFNRFRSGEYLGTRTAWLRRSG